MAGTIAEIESDIALVHETIDKVFDDGELASLLPMGDELIDFSLHHKGKRAKLTCPRWSIRPHQLRQLEEIFKEVKAPSLALRQAIAEQMGVTSRQVQVWFRNRRQRVRLADLNDDTRSDDAQPQVDAQAVAVQSPPLPPQANLTVYQQQQMGAVLDASSHGVLDDFSSTRDSRKRQRAGSPISELSDQTDVSIAATVASVGTVHPNLGTVHPNDSFDLPTSPPDEPDETVTATIDAVPTGVEVMPSSLAPASAPTNSVPSERSLYLTSQLQEHTQRTLELAHQLASTAATESDPKAIAAAQAFRAVAAACSAFAPASESEVTSSFPGHMPQPLLGVCDRSMALPQHVTMDPKSMPSFAPKGWNNTIKLPGFTQDNGANLAAARVAPETCNGHGVPPTHMLPPEQLQWMYEPRALYEPMLRGALPYMQPLSHMMPHHLLSRLVCNAQYGAAMNQAQGKASFDPRDYPHWGAYGGAPHGMGAIGHMVGQGVMGGSAASGYHSGVRDAFLGNVGAAPPDMHVEQGPPVFHNVGCVPNLAAQAQAAPASASMPADTAASSFEASLDVDSLSLFNFDYLNSDQ